MTPKLTRRESLHLGGATALLLAAPFAARAAAPEIDCAAIPAQTEGPYFVDERLNRSDIRSDPRGGAARRGVPLELALLVSRRSAGSCSPLIGATVDLWHCDAQGIYSDVRDPGFETVGQKFLRGYQITDASGAVRFTTIYPGWYGGRAVHVHFKVRSGTSELTSQLYFDDALSDRVFANAPYTKSGRRIRNGDDAIYADGGQQLVLRVEPTSAGYAARFHVALQA